MCGNRVHCRLVRRWYWNANRPSSVFDFIGADAANRTLDLRTRICFVRSNTTPLLERLNARPFRKVSGSRSTIGALDQPAARPLPPQPYAFAEEGPLRRRLSPSRTFSLLAVLGSHALPRPVVSQFESAATSSSDQTCSVTPVSIASVTRSVLWILTLNVGRRNVLFIRSAAAPSRHPTCQHAISLAMPCMSIPF